MDTFRESLSEFFSKSEHPVAFCGAGVGSKAGIPAWNGMISQLAAAIEEQDKLTCLQMQSCIEDDDLEAAANYYFLSRKVASSDRYRYISEIFSKYDASELLNLVGLPFQAYITTNYDKSLHDAFSAKHGRTCLEVHYGDPILSEALFFRDVYIARIHGRAEVPHQIVLTSSNLQTASSDDSYNSFLLHHLTRSQILFIGYSFMDPAIRNVFRCLRPNMPSVHEGRHLALLPQGVDSDLRTLFEQMSVKIARYSADNNHAELWDAISNIAEKSEKSSLKPEKLLSVQNNYSVAKRFFATCYARAKMTASMEPLYTSVMEGVLMGLIEDEYPSGIKESDLVVHLTESFPIPNSTAKEICRDCLSRLHDGRYVQRRNGAYYAEPKELRSENALSSSIDRLVQGVANRAKVREAIDLTPQETHYAQLLMNEIILKRGWDLGAAFASRRMPEELDLTEVSGSVLGRAEFGSVREKRILRALDSLLRSPEPEETELLVDVGRTSFALELVAQAPRSEYFMKSALPHKIYLDANVLMPAIVPYHPFNSLYDELLKKLIYASKDVGTSLKLCVFSGFLNEIVSHRRKARSVILEDDYKDLRSIDRRRVFLGFENMNVFVGAYLSFIRSNEELSFDQFLSKFAPYETEPQLEAFLKKRGFYIVGDVSLYRDGSIYPKLYEWLERAYANDFEKERKFGFVLEHDAKQLALLADEFGSETRALLVTADRGLRKLVGNDKFSELANFMISHVGLAQFVDLLIGRVSNSRSMARLLWGTRTSSLAEEIRDHFIDLALEQHDAAFLMPMHDLVDDLSEDMAFELEKRGLNLDTTERSMRTELDSVFSEFEDRFFDGMRHEIEKRQRHE